MKKDSRPKRRKKVLSSDTRNHPTDYWKRQFLGDAPPSGNSFDNPHMWDFFARGALRLEDDGSFISTSLRTAFEEYKLDPVDPYSWRALATLFAYVEFGWKLPPGKPGPKRPSKWTEEVLAAVRADQARLLDAGVTYENSILRLAPRFGGKREGLKKILRRPRRPTERK